MILRHLPFAVLLMASLLRMQVGEGESAEQKTLLKGALKARIQIAEFKDVLLYL